MRILIAGQTYAPALNGQSIFTVNLAEGLARIGHQVMVITSSRAGPDRLLEENGVAVQQLQSIALPFLHPDAHTTLPFNPQVSCLIRSFQPQVVHIHDHYPISGDVLRQARYRKIKTIGTDHFMPQNASPYVPLPPGLKPAFEKLLWGWMLLTYNCLDVAAAPSRTAADILRRNGLRVPVYPISCGVDLARFRHIPDLDRVAVRRRYQLDPQKTLFLFVGRTDGEKRIDLILRAFQSLPRQDIQFAIAGRGAALASLQALARDLALGDKARFLGFVSAEDLPLLLNSADVFVMPSEAELLSIASLEAMACARPMLLARAQALPELVEPGSNGYLFEPGNLRDAARCIALLADHPAQWDRMGAASLKKVQSHSLENTLHSYEKLYDGLLSGAFPRSLSPRRRINQRIRRAISNLLRS